MTARRLVNSKDMTLLSSHKPKSSQVKITWTTHQGGQKKRGNPTVHYLDGR